MQLLNFLTAFITPFEESKIPYFVTGSIASIFYGEPRLTHDIDIVIRLSQKDITQFTSVFSLEKYYCPPEEIIHIEIKRHPFGHFNLIHHESGLKADIYPDANDALHQWAFNHRRRTDLGNKLELWLAPPEYLIIRKLEFYREGGSEKHLEDIKKMLPYTLNNLDLVFLEKQINDRLLTSYWEKVRT